jgi:regulator of cell morphogenesis and NO signaling
MTATLEMTIREVVAADYRTAAVFQRFGIDFCCRGHQTIEQGCRTAGVNREQLLADLVQATTDPVDAGSAFNAWDLRTLASHIVSAHHAFVRESIPLLLQHTRKIADVHGARHTELPHIAELFGRVALELTEHMEKEERILFPYIGSLEDAARGAAPTPIARFGTILNVIPVMEREHQFVGDAMAEIRHLTSDFQPPRDACTTYRVCLQELEAFERDLHQHVHLENNVLFPKAAAIEASLVTGRD